MVSEPSQIVAVKGEIKVLKGRFNAMKISTVKWLERLQVNVTAIVHILMSLRIDDHEVFLEEDRERFNQCQNHWELFGILNFYWNYLSYYLLVHLIKKVSGAHQSDIKEKIAKQSLEEQMSLYKGDLAQFRKKTSVLMFCQAEKWRVRVEDPPPGFRALVVDYNWSNTPTLDDVENFRQSYVRHYKLQEYAMILNSIRPDNFSITVTWFVPSSAVDILKEKTPKVFRELNVSRLQFPGVAGHCVYEAHNVSSNLYTLAFRPLYWTMILPYSILNWPKEMKVCGAKKKSNTTTSL